AKDAARAHLCAQEQNKGDEMAEKLFADPDLKPAAFEHYSASLGLSREKFRACMQSPETERKIDAEQDWLMKACPQGLPCLWIQDQRLSGVQPPKTLAIEVAKAKHRLLTGNQ